MKDNAYEESWTARLGKSFAGSLVYGIMFEILLYRNMNGIGIPVLMLTTCLFLIGFFRIFEMRIKQETVFLYGGHGTTRNIYRTDHVGLFSDMELVWKYLYVLPRFDSSVLR